MEKSHSGHNDSNSLISLITTELGSRQEKRLNYMTNKRTTEKGLGMVELGRSAIIKYLLVSICISHREKKGEKLNGVV